LPRLPTSARSPGRISSPASGSAGGGFFAVKTFFLGEKPKDEAAGAKDAKSKQKPAEEVKGPGVLHSLKPFIVNLNDPSGKRYLKLRIDLELDKVDVKTEVVFEFALGDRTYRVTRSPDWQRQIGRAHV